MFQAGGLVPGSKGLHDPQPHGRVLPGAGAYRCRAPHAHAGRAGLLVPRLYLR